MLARTAAQFTEWMNSSLLIPFSLPATENATEEDSVPLSTLY